MAGTLLLIKKDAISDEAFMSMAEDFKRKTLAFYSSYFKKIDTYIQKDSLWISFCKDEEEKCYVAEDGSRVVYEGVVFALKETKRFTPKEIWELYQDKGQGFINLCDGPFVIKLYDASTKSYHVFSDIIKSHANYLAESDEALMITPFALTASALTKPELDIEAFNEYMWRYYIISDKTLLKGVSRIKPATHYSFVNNSINENVYWSWPKQFTTKSFDECVDQATENMKETARLIDKTFPNPCIDFTMGQDSRQVVASFTNQDLPFNTSLYGKIGFYEVEEVDKMSQRHNIPFNNIQLDDNYADDFHMHLEKVIRIGSAEEPAYLLARLNFMRKEQMKHGSAAMNGCDGHFYKNGLWDEMYTINLYREPKRFNTELFIKVRALSKNYPDAIFNDKVKSVKGQSKAYFTKIVSDAIEGYQDSPVSMQVDRFDLYHWLNFILAANQSANKQAQLFSPLLFRRNLEFAITVPVKWKWNLSKFQRAIVWKLSKELALEKTDFGGVTMKPLTTFTTIPFLFRYFWFQTKRVRDKVKMKVGLKVITHLQEAWDYLPLYKDIFNNKEISRLINEKWAIADILSEDEFFAYLESFKNEEKCTLSDYENLYKMLTVNTFLKDCQQFYLA